jgi:4-amino-4-deoxy-L-arabinose transferase-like glycosyltransferase
MSSTRADQNSFLAISFFPLFFLACTGLALCNVYPGDVHQNTAEIYMWSTLGFELIYQRHPPLLPWIVGGLNQIVPVNYFVLAVLSAFNVTLAAYAVWRIARLTVGEARAPLVLALYCLSPYTVWHAVKLDHNAILLSTWPLVVWAFLLSLQDPKWWRGLILGLASAAAMYAKYTSALLLFAAAIAAIASSRRRDYFRTSTPYTALSTLVLLVSPLAWAAYGEWVANTNNSTLHFALKQGAPIGSLPTYMLTTNLLRLLPVLVGFALLYYWVGPRQRESTMYLRELLILVLLPYALIIVLCVVLGLRGSQAWSMPVFAFVPILFVSLLRSPSFDQLGGLYRAAPFLLCLIPVIGLLILVSSFRQLNHNIVSPTWELAFQGASIWTHAVHSPIDIVAGDPIIDFAASLALPEHPRAWPKFGGVWWISPKLVDRYGVLAFCRQADTACNSFARTLAAGRNGWSCEFNARRSLLGMTGPILSVNAYFVPPKGSGAVQSCMLGD